MQIWNSCNALNITGNPIKDVNVKLIFLSWASKVVIDPLQVWYLVEILEILLLHVLSNDGHKFVINLFPISWESFENVHLLHFLMLMEIWNGCNALNIAGSPIQDMNAELTFLSWASKVVIDLPSSGIWWRYWKFYFCMYSLMMDTNLS